MENGKTPTAWAGMAEVGAVFGEGPWWRLVVAPVGVVG